MDKEKIKLADGSVYEIDAILYLFNLIKITFSNKDDIEKLISDPSVFKTIDILTRGGQECGQYSDYITVYKIEDNILTLSNDGSVYVEPVEPDPIDPIYPDPFEPIEPSLEDIKSFKISYLSSICNQMITDGIDMVIGDTTEHFSYKSEDQVNIKDAFDLALQTGLDIPYHCDGGGCKLYTADQIINLYISQKTNLTHHTTYFNQMRMYVNSLDDIDTVNAIEYGDELTGQYLTDYNIAMNQAAEVIKALLNGKKGE